MFDQLVTIHDRVQRGDGSAHRRGRVFLASEISWSADGTQVELVAAFPFQDVPVLHDLIVPTSATDLAGNGLAEPYEVTIGLAALKSITLLHEPALTGNSIGGASENGAIVPEGFVEPDPVNQSRVEIEYFE